MYENLDLMAKEVYQNNVAKGFWEDEERTINIIDAEGFDFTAAKKAFNAQRIALMHSELSEALEADRKDLMDDKLPQYKGLYVELADTLIRILDFCGRHGVPLGEIVQAKLEYNKTRAFKHGKAY